MANYLRIIGNNIREKRLKLGLSQNHIAEFSGVNRTYVGKIERGKANLSINLLVAIAESIDVEPSSLFEGEQS